MAGNVRRVAAVAVLALVAAACGNSGDDGEVGAGATTTEGTGTTGGGGPAAGGGDRDAFVPVEGVPGVSEDAITYAAIGTRSGNPLGTCILDCYIDGIEAYFAYRNDEGGIYGRELRVGQVLDDELGQNQVRALDVISSGDSFGVFNATLLASGWGDLDGAGIPTYVWGIHGPEATGRRHVFPHNAVICTNCIGRVVPFAARESGATRVASLGYNASENSRQCARGNAQSIERYSAEIGAELAYLNADLAYGLPNGIAPEVTAMRDAGVDLIATCMDLNGMKTLAQELERQGMADVVLVHPNTYDQQFVAEAGGIFDGDIVSVQFLPFEAEAGDTPLRDFFDWMDETGSEPTELAMVGWINADLAFQGLLAAGPELDRAAVVDATNRMTDYDAGGLINPIDWTHQHEPEVDGEPGTGFALECTVLLRVVDGAFETLLPPETPWVCWDNDTDDWSEPTPTSFG